MDVYTGFQFRISFPVKASIAEIAETGINGDVSGHLIGIQIGEI